MTMVRMMIVIACGDHDHHCHSLPQMIRSQMHTLQLLVHRHAYLYSNRATNKARTPIRILDTLDMMVCLMCKAERHYLATRSHAFWAFVPSYLE